MTPLSVPEKGLSLIGRLLRWPRMHLGSSLAPSHAPSFYYRHCRTRQAGRHGQAACVCHEGQSILVCLCSLGASVSVGILRRYDRAPHVGAEFVDNAEQDSRQLATCEPTNVMTNGLTPSLSVVA